MSFLADHPCLRCGADKCEGEQLGIFFDHPACPRPGCTERFKDYMAKQAETQAALDAAKVKTS